MSVVRLGSVATCGRAARHWTRAIWVEMRLCARWGVTHLFSLLRNVSQTLSKASQEAEYFHGGEKIPVRERGYTSHEKNQMWHYGSRPSASHNATSAISILCNPIKVWQDQQASRAPGSPPRRKLQCLSSHTREHRKEAPLVQWQRGRPCPSRGRPMLWQARAWADLARGKDRESAERSPHQAAL